MIATLCGAGELWPGSDCDDESPQRQNEHVSRVTVVRGSPIKDWSPPFAEKAGAVIGKFYRDHAGVFSLIFFMRTSVG
ncbi:MAG: hypothetical protein ACRD22_14500, partial [Terriglobia bacterium]